MLSVVLIGSVLIGVITALLNATGIDDVMTKTLGPATQMAANAVEWRMGNYWTALQEAAASDIFRDSDPMDQALCLSGMKLPSEMGFCTQGKWMPTAFPPRATATQRKIISSSVKPLCSPTSPIL